MAIPLFVGAGAGALSTGGTAATVSKTGCTAGNLVIVHIAAAGGTAEASYLFPVVNAEDLNGADNDLTLCASANVGSGPEARHAMYLGRVMANGTCSTDFAPSSGTDEAIARIYEFSGEAEGTTFANICENDNTTHGAGAGTGTSVNDDSVITSAADRLCLQIVCVTLDTTLGNFTGETGGDWTEAVAEYANATAVMTIQLQTAAMAVAGTIDGGTMTIGSAGWGMFGTAIKPAVPAVSFLPARRRGR